MKIELNSDLSQLNKIDSIIEQICKDYKLYDTYYGCLSMAIYEAAKNAMIHGNKMDASKKISIEFALSFDEIAISVSDQGKGFNFEKELLLLNSNPTGNGLEIIQLTSDAFEYSNHGSTLEMKFNVVNDSQFKMNEKRRAKLMESKKQSAKQGIKKNAE